jgi:hypothetical protein
MLLRTALAATELNQRAPILDLTKDGVSFVGTEGLAPKQDTAGKIDRGATALDHLKKARDYAAVAVTPDKALIFGTVGGVGGSQEEGQKGKISAGGAIVGSLLGAVADVAEAVPAAVLSVIYLGSAGVNALRR